MSVRAPMRQILASIRKKVISQNSLFTGIQGLVSSSRDKVKALDQRATLALFGFGATKAGEPVIAEAASAPVTAASATTSANIDISQSATSMLPSITPPENLAEISETVSFAYVPPESWSKAGFILDKPIMLIDYLYGLGLPMWGAIVVLAVIVRSATLPLTVKQQIASMRLVMIQPEMQAMQAKLKVLTPNSLAHKEVQAAIQGLMKKNGVSLGKTFGYSLVTMPIMITCFMAVRNMVFDPEFHDAMSVGGIGHFPDLTADAGWIMASVAATTNVIVFEANNRGEPLKTLAPTQRMFRQAMRAAVVVSFPFLANFPLATSVYLISNNLISTVSTLCTRSDWFRRMNKLPTVVEAVALRLKAQELTARSASKIAPPANAPMSAYVLPTPRAKAKKVKGNQK